jgi:hypothetical protein
MPARETTSSRAGRADHLNSRSGPFSVLPTSPQGNQERMFLRSHFKLIL